MTQVKLVIKAGLWPWPARVAAREHNIECHGGIPTAHVERDPDHIHPGVITIPLYRVYCEQCAELVADDEETKGESDE